MLKAIWQIIKCIDIKDLKNGFITLITMPLWLPIAFLVLILKLLECMGHDLFE